MKNLRDLLTKEIESYEKAVREHQVLIDFNEDFDRAERRVAECMARIEHLIREIPEE
jgi:hypothetical protein